MFAWQLIRFLDIYSAADHRLWYYGWPFQATVAFGLVVLLGEVWPRLNVRSRRVVNAVLLVIAVANVSQWPRNRDRSLHAIWFPYMYRQTDALKASLRDGRVDPRLDDEYRAFLYRVWDLSPGLDPRSR